MIPGEVLSFLDTFERLIIEHDIRVAIEGKCNYLAALGLSTYTEVFGGLYRGTLQIGQGRPNYDAFIKNFFGNYYVDVDSRLVKDGLNGLYSAVRSGLVHEFLMKSQSMVVMDTDPPEIPITCGIIYDPSAKYKIIFIVKQYFKDFIKAFNDYKSKVEEFPDFAKNAKKALNSIDSFSTKW